MRSLNNTVSGILVLASICVVVCFIFWRHPHGTISEESGIAEDIDYYPDGYGVGFFDGSNVYAVSFSQEMICVVEKTGQVLWRSQLGDDGLRVFEVHGFCGSDLLLASCQSNGAAGTSRVCLVRSSDGHVVDSFDEQGVVIDVFKSKEWIIQRGLPSGVQLLKMSLNTTTPLWIHVVEPGYEVEASSLHDIVLISQKEIDAGNAVPWIVTCLNAEDGRVLWRKWVTGGNGSVGCVATEKYLYCHSGELLWVISRSNNQFVEEMRSVGLIMGVFPIQETGIIVCSRSADGKSRVTVFAPALNEISRHKMARDLGPVVWRIPGDRVRWGRSIVSLKNFQVTDVSIQNRGMVLFSERCCGNWLLCSGYRNTGDRLMIALVKETLETNQIQVLHEEESQIQSVAPVIEKTKPMGRAFLICSFFVCCCAVAVVLLSLRRIRFEAK